MMLVNDLVIKETICNMNCAYCLTNTSSFNANIVNKMEKDCLNYTYGTKLYQNMDKVTNIIYKNFKPSILKISGGEILLINNIIDYIKKHCSNYKKIQILTNGLSLTIPFINELKSISNACLQISLDHHTLYGNFYRTNCNKFLKRILMNLDYAVSQNIPIEINCVLHDRNTPIIDEFAEYLLKYKNKVILLPFPVRGKIKDKFKINLDKLKGFERLINNYQKYQSILPPKIYLEYLYRFIYNGKREINCYLPLLSIGSFEDGTITPCPNYWFTSLGNVISENEEYIIERISKNNIYKILCNRKHLVNECSNCFTPWEILNLYVDNQLTLNELKKIPSFAYDDINKDLDYIRSEI